jgi:predicted deacylase
VRLRTIEPGTKLSTRLRVPGCEFELPLLVARGHCDGPRVVILGGVHGDEYEGMVAAAAVWRDLDLQVLSGSVTVVPVANPPAFQAGTRTSPIDDLNLARVFPGSSAGSATERIAMPLLAGAYAADSDLGRRCLAAAAAFGAPVLWAHPDIAPGRSLSVAIEAGVANLYVECGGGGRVRPDELRAYRTGVQRVLSHLGALPPAHDPVPEPSVRLRSTGDLDTWLAVQSAGILVERVQLLECVETGQPLGDVLDELGNVLETLEAPHPGVIVMARRTARVRPGDGGYMVARPEPDSMEDRS